MDEEALLMGEESVSIKEYFDAKVSHLEEISNERDRRYEQRFQAQEQAISVAEAAAERWRLNANEWRSAMTDRERNFFSRGMGYVVGAVSIFGTIVAIAMAIVTLAGHAK